MNVRELDFRHLIVFQELVKRRKVNDVALELNISQPSISRCLARLRDHFGDPLFVKTQHSMDPTPYALEIFPTIQQMLDLYYSQLTRKHEFDPQHSNRTVRVAASDIGHLILLPVLIRKFDQCAPRMKIQAVPLGFHSLIGELETGAVDFAMGAFPTLHAGIHERRLFTEHYVCLARSKHRLIKDKLTRTIFEESQHIVVTAEGIGHIHEQIAKDLMAMCPQENIRVISHSFLTSAVLAERTDLIVTLPSRIVPALDLASRVRTFDPPVELPTFEVKLYWHSRFHRDPANRWLRKLIHSLF